MTLTVGSIGRKNALFMSDIACPSLTSPIDKASDTINSRPTPTKRKYQGVPEGKPEIPVAQNHTVIVKPYEIFMEHIVNK